MQEQNGYDPDRREELFPCKKEEPDRAKKQGDCICQITGIYKENTRPGLKAPFNFPLFREVGRPKPISLKSGKKHICLPFFIGSESGWNLTDLDPDSRVFEMFVEGFQVLNCLRFSGKHQSVFFPGRDGWAPGFVSDNVPSFRQTSLILPIFIVTLFQFPLLAQVIFLRIRRGDKRFSKSDCLTKALLLDIKEALLYSHLKTVIYS